MQKEAVLAALNAQIVDKFRRAIEIGRWENGDKLSDAQRQTCMQAVLIWEHERLPVHERTGYIPKKDAHAHAHDAHKACDVEHNRHYPNLPDEQALRLVSESPPKS